VFDDYRKAVEQSYVAPILLFNEADGILSTRKSIGGSEVSQTENAIQNILLQEMEDFNGIMIATTNLTGNLDKAFERRFLYKIKFEKPTPEIQRMIWQDKIKGISESDATSLARKFDLNGGQIDNVARKYFLKKVLYDKFPSIAELEEYCEEELTLQVEKRNIGFTRNIETCIV
jgi:SpoVK/Ycf46/Vps4 family AAA+-type ATPase